MRAQHLGTLRPEHVSKVSLSALNNDKFQVLSDARTMLGEQSNILRLKNTFMMEDIATHSRQSVCIPSQKYSHHGAVYLHNYRLNRILLGQTFEQVFQFDLNPGRSYLRLQADYRSRRKAHVVTMCLVENIAVVASKGSLKFVDMARRRVVLAEVDVCTSKIFSIGGCRLSESKVVLCVNAVLDKNHNYRTKIFDITGLVNAARPKRSEFDSNSPE